MRMLGRDDANLDKTSPLLRGGTTARPRGRERARASRRPRRVAAGDQRHHRGIERGRRGRSSALGRPGPVEDRPSDGFRTASAVEFHRSAALPRPRRVRGSTVEGLLATRRRRIRPSTGSPARGQVRGSTAERLLTIRANGNSTAERSFLDCAESGIGRRAVFRRLRPIELDRSPALRRLRRIFHSPSSSAQGPRPVARRGRRIRAAPTARGQLAAVTVSASALLRVLPRTRHPS